MTVQMDFDKLVSLITPADSLRIDRRALVNSINHDGIKLKQVICMEELAELTQATSKALRGKLNRENMIEEIADVLICIEMLKIMYGINKHDIQTWIDAKIERQKERDADEQTTGESVRADKALL